MKDKIKSNRNTTKKNELKAWENHVLGLIERGILSENYRNSVLRNPTDKKERKH